MAHQVDHQGPAGPLRVRRRPLAADIYPSFPYSSPSEPVIFDGSLFFRADGQTQGNELWRYTVRRAAGQHTVTVPAGQVANNRDFGNFRVVNVGADLAVNEGTPVNLSSTVLDPNPSTPSTFAYLWQVTADNGQIIPNGSGTTLSFTALDSGIYTVTLSVSDSADGKVYQDMLIVSVKNVAPILPAGTNTTITEGSTFARNVSFTDPGADVWTAMVNYGDGPAAVVLTGLASGSPIALDHRYFDLIDELPVLKLLIRDACLVIPLPGTHHSDPIVIIKIYKTMRGAIQTIYE